MSRSKRIVSLIGCLVFVFVAVSSEADDRKKKNKNRNSRNQKQATAASEAERARIIKSLEAQVAAAKKVLSAAQSKNEMTDDRAREAIKALASIRGEIESASADVHEAARMLRSIEADILDDQDSDSEFARAQTAVDSSEAGLRKLIYKLANSNEPAKPQVTQGDNDPEEESPNLILSKLPKSTAEFIRNDPAYTVANKDANEARHHLVTVRTALFESDSQWQAAKRALDKARARSRDETSMAHPAQADAAAKIQYAQNVDGIIAQAKAIIAHGERNLEKLRESNKSQENKSKSKK